jgi:hypothetical protein
MTLAFKLPQLPGQQLPPYLDSERATPLCWPKSNAQKTDRIHMTFSKTARAIATDSHFLIPLIVFFLGLALLITLH